MDDPRAPILGHRLKPAVRKDPHLETRTARWALITGASAGLGQSLARLFAGAGINLILVARSEDALINLRKELSALVQVHVFPQDLLTEDAGARIQSFVSDSGIEVDFLVNNAGMGHHDLVVDSPLTTQLSTIDLNVRALTELTHRFLPGMVKRRSGGVLNVASLAAFLPGARMAVYFASKAYVLSFSEALDEELRGMGVHVTAICPGPINTGFFKKSGMFKLKILDENPWALMEPNDVAKIAFEGFMAKKRVIIPGMLNRSTRTLSRLFPRTMVTKLAASLMRER